MNRFRIQLFILSLCTLPALAGPVRPSMPIPAAAKAIVQQVHAVSQSHDFGALAKLMDDEFTSSFGGDSGINEAIADWKQSPDKLKQLARATGATCEVVADIVQCPRGAGVGYRAGFKQTKRGWRMVYFVAGD